MSSKNKDGAWKTSMAHAASGRRTPTLQEAIVAAQGLSDDLDEQARIAGSPMGLPTQARSVPNF